MTEEFYELIKQRSARTGYFHCQFSPYHMMKYKGRYSLIGLEGLYPFYAMPSAKLSYQDYENFIAGLCHQRVGQKESGEQHYFRKSPLAVRGARFLWLKTRSFLLEPKINHIHLIER